MPGWYHRHNRECPSVSYSSAQVIVLHQSDRPISLRIFTLPKLDVKVQQTALPLSYTPRKLATHPNNKFFYVAEADHRVLSPSAQQAKVSSMNAKDVNQEILQLPNEQFGYPRADAGNWASCIGVYDTTVAPESSLVAKVELEHNEAAFTVAVVPFASQNGQPYLIVGTAKETYLAPRACRQAFLHTYEISPDGRTLTLMHRTEVEDVPTALTAFQGRLLAGVGKVLRMYDLGRKKLLRKTENKVSYQSILFYCLPTLTRLLIQHRTLRMPSRHSMSTEAVSSLAISRIHVSLQCTRHRRTA